jgi:O-antigen/teichoic acid export membrane protein
LSRRKAALATFAGSGSTTLIAALQSILLLPIYLQKVGTESYGIWLATGEILLWMVAFDCGIPNLMIQRIGASHAKGKTQDIGRHFATCVAMLASTAAVLGSLVWGLSPLVVQMFSQGRGIDPNVVSALKLAAIATALVLLNYSFQGLGRALQQTFWQNIASVISTLVGFVATYLLLIKGWGLQSIAIGLIVRSGGSLLGNVLAYLMLDGFKEARYKVVPSAPIAREYLRETPLLLTSGIAYALMNNSQIAIANLVLGPTAAVFLSVARRLADLVKAALDMVSYATEGGFAHLFASGDKPRIARVLREIDERFHLVAIVLLTGLLATNGAFVTIWTKGQFEPGSILTAFIATRTFMTAWSYLGISRLRAAGAFRTSSVLLLADCTCRIVLMFVGANLFGIVGICMGACLPPIGIGLLARRKLNRELGPVPQFNPNVAAACLGLAIASAAIGVIAKPTTWTTVISLGIVVSATSAAILILANRKTNVAISEPLQRAA